MSKKDQMERVQKGPIVVDHPDLRHVVWDGTAAAHSAIQAILPEGWWVTRIEDKPVEIVMPDFNQESIVCHKGSVVASLDDNVWVIPPYSIPKTIEWKPDTGLWEGTLHEGIVAGTGAAIGDTVRDRAKTPDGQAWQTRWGYQQLDIRYDDNNPDTRWAVLLWAGGRVAATTAGPVVLPPKDIDQ